MDWQSQLISLYLFICKEYQHKLRKNMARISNYSNLTFSDEEVMTIYIFGIMSKRHTVKEIYEYTDRHLRDWFKALPSYVAFVQRLNKVSHLFSGLMTALYHQLPKDYNQSYPLLLDSMPIILAHRGRRFNAKIAPEIATNNGYCATKKLHYYGIKLHAAGSYKKGYLPIPQYFGITDAGTADIRFYEELSKQLPENSRVFADKAYQTGNQPVADQGGITLYTPVKKAKGQELLDAADRLLSSAISSVRQPIESLFNWIEEKTNIQIASKVRSYNGLMVHVFGKISVALFMMQTRFCS
ncbi:transposase [Candidatus Tisiphia endosymbiont of Hybos culiciformis]|uniref:transposase n=1 Tax=Candidatus Tisiphia endosymbiont of Hybos culiciformis TaxID=3139331 RepID=UPI003CCB4C3F